MLVTAWNNGSYHVAGAGYGITIRITDRDKYFSPRWEKVVLKLGSESEDIKVNLSKSFWENCPELRSKYIGIWLVQNRKATWRNGQPPKMIMEHIRHNKFKIKFKNLVRAA